MTSRENQWSLLMSSPLVPVQINGMILLKHGFLDSLRDYTIILASRVANAPLMVIQFIGCVSTVCTINLDAQDFHQWMSEDEQVGVIDPQVSLWDIDPCILIRNMTVVNGSRDAQQWAMRLGCPFYEFQITSDTSSWSIICADIHYGEYTASELIVEPTQRYVMPGHSVEGVTLKYSSDNGFSPETPPLDSLMPDE
jgi:hypothetical protein